MLELPRAIRKELATLARKLNREHRALFANSPTLKKRAGQFLTALLPPKPRRRGRPGIQNVTTAIRFRRVFIRQFPNESWVKIWERIYPQGHSELFQHERITARRRPVGIETARPLETKKEEYI